MRFKKRPIEVDAELFMGDDYHLPKGVIKKRVDWKGPYAHDLELKHGALECFFLKTPSGDVQISVGDMLVTDEDGDMRPCNPKLFKKLFEPA